MAGYIFAIGDCPEPCRMLAVSLACTHHTPAAFPLVFLKTKNVSRDCHMSSGEQNCPLAENRCACLQVGGRGVTLRGRPWGGQGSPVLLPAPPGRPLTCHPGCVLALRTHGTTPRLSGRCHRGVCGATATPRRGPAAKDEPTAANAALLAAPRPRDPAPRPPVSVRTQRSAQLEGASRCPSPV